MSWSKITSKQKKPVGWWYHKLMCEFYYCIGKYSLYNKHLLTMVGKYNLNIYGETYTRKLKDGN